MVKGAFQAVEVRMNASDPCQLGCRSPQTNQPYIYKKQNNTCHSKHTSFSFETICSLGVNALHLKKIKSKVHSPR